MPASHRPIELVAGQAVTPQSIDRALDGAYTAERVDSQDDERPLPEPAPALQAPALGRLQIRTEGYRIRDQLQKTVARVDVLVPALVSPGGSHTPLGTRLRLQELRGYADEREQVLEALRPALGLSAVRLTLVDEAVLAAGGHVPGFSSKVSVTLRLGEPAGPAVARVLHALLDVIDANLPGALAGSDPEFLHDYRVSVRRTRSVQRQLHRVFEAEPLKRARGEFKWLQQVTGDARDLDVYVSGFERLRELLPSPIGADLEPLLLVLRRRRALAHATMGRALRSDRAGAARADWEALLDQLTRPPDGEQRERANADRPDHAARPIDELACKRIVDVYRQMVKAGKAIAAASPPEELHELRKQGKELRYLLELFGSPLRGEQTVSPLIKALKGLQDVLGRHQDRAVQAGMLYAVAAEVAVLPGGPRALMAMGVLAQRLEDQAALAREEFAAAFAEFAAGGPRRLVKDTFA